MAATAGTCAYCLRPVRVRTDGKLARHNVALPVKAGTTVRRCSGSDRPPRTEADVKAAAKRTRDAVDKAWGR
jgi:hypothetical protein